MSLRRKELWKTSPCPWTTYPVAHPDIKAEANMFDSDAEDPVDYDFEPSESDDDI